MNADKIADHAADRIAERTGGRFGAAESEAISAAVLGRSKLPRKAFHVPVQVQGTNIGYAVFDTPPGLGRPVMKSFLAPHMAPRGVRLDPHVLAKKAESEEFDLGALLTDDATAAAERFVGLREKDLSPADRMAQYSIIGSQLVRMPVSRVGGHEVSGHEFINGLRDNPVARGFAPLIGANSFDEGSRQHYQSFSEGPVEAYRQLMREEFPRGLPKALRREGTGQKVDPAINAHLQSFAEVGAAVDSLPIRQQERILRMASKSQDPWAVALHERLAPRIDRNLTNYNKLVTPLRAVKGILGAEDYPEKVGSSRGSIMDLQNWTPAMTQKVSNALLGSQGAIGATPRPATLTTPSGMANTAGAVVPIGAATPSVSKPALGPSGLSTPGGRKNLSAGVSAPKAQATPAQPKLASETAAVDAFVAALGPGGPAPAVEPEPLDGPYTGWSDPTLHDGSESGMDQYEIGGAVARPKVGGALGLIDRMVLTKTAFPGLVPAAKAGLGLAKRALPKVLGVADAAGKVDTLHSGGKFLRGLGPNM